MRQVLIISSFLVMIFASCTGGKKAVDNTAGIVDLSAEDAIRRVRASYIDFQRLNSNADLYVNTAMFKGSINAKIRIVKDSAIWVSATKLGFEVGRVLITPDSVFMVERLQKTYIRESIDGLSELAGIALGYKMIEDFLLGNPYLDEDLNTVSYLSQDSFSIRPKFNQVDIEHLVDRKDFKLLQTTVRDDKSKMDAEMEFQDYRTLSGEQIFSYFRNITLDNGVDDPTTGSIKFNNPELNVEKSIKFSIPSSYSVRKF